MNQPALLTFAGEVTIQAAAGDGGKAPKLSIVGYNGGMMNVPGWGDVALDLAGLRMPAKIPVLADHNGSLSGVVGHGAPSAKGGRLLVEGSIVEATEAARQVVALAQGGFEFQASLGARPTRFERIKAGETVKVNGQTLTAGGAGLLLVHAADLREISITAVGADGQTAVSIAAHLQGSNMPDPQPKVEPTEVQKTEVELERERSASIMAMTDTYPNAGPIAAQAIRENWDVQKAELEMLRANRPTAKAWTGGNAAQPADVLEASLLLRANVSDDLAVKAYGEQTVDVARRSRLNSLVDLCAATLRLEGRESRGEGRDELIRAAFSTASLPNILSNVVGRTLVAAYDEATSNWRSFATVKNAANFKPQSAIRPSSLRELEQLGADGEIKHSEIKEEDKYDWRIDTFARMIGVTRQTIIDDDLGFADSLAPMLGTAAARSLNDLLWKTILANAGNFFHNDNNNLLGAGSDLSVDSLALAVSTMRSQRDSRGNDIDIQPVALAVSPALELAARALLRSAEIRAAVGQVTGNPVAGIVDNLVVESRLANEDKFAGADEDSWYLFAGPMSNGVIVGFLDGRTSPTVEIDAAPFNTLGIQLRVYHDYGCALGDPKAAVKATGEEAGG